MKPGPFTHTIAVLLSSVSACFAPSAPAQVPTKKVQLSKKQNRLTEDVLLKVDPVGYTPPGPSLDPKRATNVSHGKRKSSPLCFGLAKIRPRIIPYRITPAAGTQPGRETTAATTIRGRRAASDYIPVNFTPRQNPFYCALPYNDKAREGHRPEAPKVVPWFKEAYRGPGVSVCKDRWVAIRKGNRTVYAQWEDAGPFRTDHWEYVFGNERPKPNLNRGAGLDVSPAVRDYLGLQDTDVTDWKFVEFSEVPPGPWTKLGNNNTFVINQRKAEQQLVKAKEKSSVIFR